MNPRWPGRTKLMAGVKPYHLHVSGRTFLKRKGN